MSRLHENCLRQWDILNERLSAPEQNYIALPDRPSLADISYLPFSMPWMFEYMGVDIRRWPNIDKWSRLLLGRPAVQAILTKGPTYGH